MGLPGRGFLGMVDWAGREVWRYGSGTAGTVQVLEWRVRSPNTRQHTSAPPFGSWLSGGAHPAARSATTGTSHQLSAELTAPFFFFSQVVDGDDRPWTHEERAELRSYEGLLSHLHAQIDADEVLPAARTPAAQARRNQALQKLEERQSHVSGWAEEESDAEVQR
jgi:hypothetical protein